jgi:hypothetical protein
VFTQLFLFQFPFGFLIGGNVRIAMLLGSGDIERTKKNAKLSIAINCTYIHLGTGSRSSPRGGGERFDIGHHFNCQIFAAPYNVQRGRIAIHAASSSAHFGSRRLPTGVESSTLQTSWMVSVSLVTTMHGHLAWFCSAEKKWSGANQARPLITIGDWESRLSKFAVQNQKRHQLCCILGFH